jgi:hypothetical protein
LTLLSAAQLAKLPANALAGISALHLSKLAPASLAGLSTTQAAALPASALTGLSATQLALLGDSALEGLSGEQLANIAPAVLANLSVERFAKLSPDALGGLTGAQMALLPAGALAELSAEQLGGLPALAIAALSQAQFAEVSTALFAQMRATDMTRWLANLNLAIVTPAEIAPLLPAGMTLASDGSLTVPAGTILSYPPFPTPALAAPSCLPEIPNFSKGLGLGGAGIPVLSELNATLAAVGYPHFTFSQANEGTLLVSASNGVKLSFIPALGTMQQMPLGSPVSLTQDNTGKYVLLTPLARQYVMIPVLHDIPSFIETGHRVCLDARGHTRLILPSGEGGVVIADPWWIASRQPGITRGADQRIVAGYPDGRGQILYPAIQSPEEFITLGKNFVQTVLLPVNGEILGFTADGQTWRFGVNPLVLPGNTPQAPAFLAGPVANNYIFVNRDGDKQVFYRR